MKSQNLIGGVNLLPHVVVVAELRGEVGADVLGGVVDGTMVSPWVMWATLGS